tara:strand:- start:153 stop:584 length:432 start_codon:yes stop_codon:yes gene_type:complete
MGIKKFLKNLEARGKGKKPPFTEKEISDDLKKKAERTADDAKKGLFDGLRGAEILAKDAASGIAKTARGAAKGAQDATKKASETIDGVAKKTAQAFDDAAKEIKDQAEAAKKHPSSGSKFVDTIFPTGGHKPKDSGPNTGNKS